MNRPTTLASRLLVATFVCALPLAAQSLPPVPIPRENPLTAEKAVLGKILFFDEQLSSDNRVACATCHMPEDGGADPRAALHPGSDSIFGSRDDTFGSPGVRRSDDENDYALDARFGFGPQVTRRNAPSAIGAGFFEELFWDGRAGSTFRDPATGAVSIASGGALESQAVAPILDAAEMAHDARTWSQVLTKLGQVRPLALATNWPADVTTALAARPDYGELFRRAFGDRAITTERLAFAIASYERTLVPDQSPWDRFARGDATALTADQHAGRQLFFGIARCSQCHAPPLFSDGSYRRLGLRPPFEDLGRLAVTGQPGDGGRFKVPSLRNASLRTRFMHTGQFGSLQQVVGFYDAPPPQMMGRDPLIAPIGLTQAQRAQLVAFVESLTDPRVANATGPFSRPTLWSERVAAPGEVFGAAGPGSNGASPRMVAETPARLGIPDFRIGVHGGLGGAFAAFGLSLGEAPAGSTVLGAPLHVQPATTWLTPMFLSGVGAGQGVATFRAPLPGDPALAGLVLIAQWFVADPGAPQGLATSAGARIRLF